MVPVKNRKASTLIPIIKHFILPGTTILSDCWLAKKHIRAIKEDALGPEARAAQQRELERIDRLEKQQCSDLPALAKKLDVSDKSSPVPNLEHSQHLPTTEVIYFVNLFSFSYFIIQFVQCMFFCLQQQRAAKDSHDGDDGVGVPCESIASESGMNFLISQYT